MLELNPFTVSSSGTRNSVVISFSTTSISNWKRLLFDGSDLLGLDDAEYFLDVRVDREAEFFDEL
jgi:hypothetical protein